MITHISHTLIENTYNEIAFRHSIVPSNAFNPVNDYYDFCNHRYAVGGIKHTINDDVITNLDVYIDRFRNQK